VSTTSSIRDVGALDNSGVDAQKVLCLTLGDRHAVRQRGELSEEHSAPISRQKSAEGIIGSAQARLGRHPKAERRGNREAEPQRGRTEGPNGRQAGALEVGPRPGPCPAAGAALRGAEG
jgi:hypothetical protein